MTRRKLQKKPGKIASGTLDKAQLLCDLELQKTRRAMQLQETSLLRRELEIARNRYDLLFDSAPTGHVSFDARTVVKLINATGANFLGKKPAQIIGLPLSLLVVQEHLGRFMDHLRVCRNYPGQQAQIELDFIGKKSENISLQVLSIAVPEDDKFIYHTTLIDVRSYKLAEKVVHQAKEFSDKIIQSVRQPLLVLDVMLRVILANSAFYRLFALPQKSESEEVDLAALMGSAFPQLEGLLKKAISETKGFEEVEVRAKTADGDLRILRLSARMMVHRTHLGPLLLLAMDDITERHQAEEVRENLVTELGRIAHELEDRVNERTTELREANAKLQTLSARLLEAQELERRHLAGELHDEIGQQLTCLQILTIHQMAIAPPPLKRALKETQAATAELLKTVRQLSSNLRPQLLDDFGLLAALEWHIDRFQKRTGIKIRLEKKSFQEELINSFLRSVMFRVAQEALTNVARHAQTNRVNMKLSTRKGFCRLEVRDRGQGFDVKKVLEKGAFGLAGMQERVFLAGGKLNLDSAPGKGTTVALEIPLISLQSDAVQSEHSPKLKTVQRSPR